MFVLADIDGKVDFLLVIVLVDCTCFDVEPGIEVEKLTVDVTVVWLLVVDMYGVGDIVEGILDDEEDLLEDGDGVEVVVDDEDELDNEEVVSEIEV